MKRFKTSDWRQQYARRLLITDTLTLLVTVFGVQYFWFGNRQLSVVFSRYFSDLEVTYTSVSFLIVIIWFISLSLYGTRRTNLIGSGNDEYRLVADATVRFFGIVAIAAYLLQAQLARGYILLALPIGLFALLGERWLWRQWLIAQRKRGIFLKRSILVGSEISSDHVGEILISNPSSGFEVIGAFLSHNFENSEKPNYLLHSHIPVLGSIDDALPMMDGLGADTLIITSSDTLTADDLRKLSWGLEPGRQHLVVAPNLIDVSGPRIHMRPVSGLPLVHVETPQLAGIKAVVKTFVDFVGSLVIALLLAPMFLFIAALVKSTSSGPILFSQTRIGRDGKPFTMLKFRTMVTNAEQLLAELEQARREEQDLGNEVLFKMKDDPRVTKVGKILRRYSLDELPQIFNVVRGEMSLVGPRPPLPREVENYEDHVHRRFLVKPGMTGLWQVSGRSELSWEESVRADLFYVENWSLTGDFFIIWRTFKAVLFPGNQAA